jgi:hypothetical protein
MACSSQLEEIEFLCEESTVNDHVFTYLINKLVNFRKHLEYPRKFSKSNVHTSLRKSEEHQTLMDHGQHMAVEQFTRIAAQLAESYRTLSV